MNSTLFSTPKIQATLHNKDWFDLQIPYHKKIWIRAVKNIIGRSWLPKDQRWRLPNVKATFYQLRDEIGLKNINFQFTIEANIPDVYLPQDGQLLTSKKQISTATLFENITTPQQEAILQVSELMTLNRYRYRTIKTYRHALIHLFASFKYLHPEQVEPQHVKSYILDLIQRKHIGVTRQNQIINAYKFYAEKILKHPKAFIDIPRPRRSRRLPGVLSTSEVIKIIQATNNLKHKVILLLIYSAGLRLSESVNILLQDIQIERRAIHIKDSKGKKDRYVVLAETLLPYLRTYLKEYKPQRWLFEGQYGGRYSPRSVQNIFSRALTNADVNKYATLHTLRHSYATHCLENGHNLKDIQHALGHRSLKTTSIYLHISSDAMRRLKSPLDQLKLI